MGIIILMLIGQIPLPPEFDKTSKYLYDIPRGQSVRVNSNALIIDPNGKCWIRGDWIAETASNKFTKYKELEIIRSKNGYIVKVLPLWEGSSYRYPEWERGIRFPKSIDIPVIALIVIPRPKSRMSYFSELDAYYRSGIMSTPPLPYYRR